jgi:hypothetical protein
MVRFVEPESDNSLLAWMRRDGQSSQAAEGISMQRKFNLCLVLGAVLITLDAAEPSSKLTVFVYNYAELPPEVLAQAEAEAGRAYRRSRIEIQWIQCPLSPAEASRFPACKIPPGPTGLVLRMLSLSMSERLQRVEHSYGFSPYPDDGSFASVASVFAHAAELLAARTGVHLGVFLGQIVAHELGHLLLGPGSHSVSGIMHSPWHGKDLELIAQGTKLFMPWEAAKMRSAISAREAVEREMGMILTAEKK